jgi:hypothetical protein
VKATIGICMLADYSMAKKRQHSSWLPGVLGAEVADARDGSWRRCFATWLYLAAKPSHVGVDVDGLACPPAPSYGLLPSNEGTGPPARHCLVPSLQWVVALFGGCEALWFGYLVES